MTAGRMMNYGECYQNGVRLLQEAGVPEAKLDARLLLEYVCGTDCNALLVHGDEPVEAEKQEKYVALLTKRCERIPLQQLTGEQEFCGLSFLVNEHVLIPRQDTEILVEEAVRHLRDGMELLDMCTGSGCILISLLAMKDGVRGTGVDISKEAISVAVENGRRILPVENQPKWLMGDLFAPLVGNGRRYDMIVSNPPYIKSDVIESLMPEVRDHEPRGALDGREDGLFFYRRIIDESRVYLKEGGWLLFEIGADQGEAVKGLMADAGFSDLKIRKDYAGLDRVVMGCLRTVSSGMCAEA